MAQLRVRRWAVKSDGVAPEIDRYIDRDRMRCLSQRRAWCRSSVRTYGASKRRQALTISVFDPRCRLRTKHDVEVGTLRSSFEHRDSNQ